MSPGIFHDLCSSESLLFLIDLLGRSVKHRKLNIEHFLYVRSSLAAMGVGESDVM